MNNCLNRGNFEGVSGAKQHIVLKLKLANAMITIVKNVMDGKQTNSLRTVLSECQDNVSFCEELKTSMDNLLLWLFLSGRASDEELYLSNLSNNSTQTPATYLLKQITTATKDILACVGDCI